MKVLCKVLLALLIADLVLASCSAEPARPPAPATLTEAPDISPEVGSVAPDFQLQSLDGRTFSLSGVRGKPVLLNFWATWCGPCRQEMPYLQEVYEAYSDKGLVMAVVDIGESKADVETFLRAAGLSLPILLDSQTSVARQYRVAAIPTSFFIDRDGVIKDKKIGAFSGIDEIKIRLLNIMP